MHQLPHVMGVYNTPQNPPAACLLPLLLVSMTLAAPAPALRAAQLLLASWVLLAACVTSGNLQARGFGCDGCEQWL